MTTSATPTGGSDASPRPGRGARVGFTSGRLTVVEVLDLRPALSARGNERWVLVECSCHDRTRKELRWGSVRSNNTRSCGCLDAESRRTRRRTHGESGTPLYRAWSAMKQRCSNPNIRGAHRYSGRGITVCTEWVDSFETFQDWAMRHGYVEGKELDRIDNNLGYSPDNCRWVTKLENLDNRSKYLPLDLEAWLHEHARQLACTPYEVIKQALESYLGVSRVDDADLS